MDPDTLVETKFFPPRVRTDTVARPRLTDRLRGGQERLILVSAPAGFGKTTFLGRWLAAEDAAVAWVSLDEDDRAPASFWTYVLSALDRAAPGVGADALASLRAGRPPVLTGVLNELSVLPGDLVLVLDDYHLADGPDLRPDMEFFVGHLPPQVRLVISTRADPGLPLARLRARGELTEIRAADLRFTAAEAGVYLQAATGLSLSDADIGALEGRTEGWVAALQLAALSLRGRDDVAGFIDGFAGDDRFVVDYLGEEVLDRQPAPVRRFLLRTSVLDRLSGELCDAVTSGDDGRRMLETLDRANLFVVPLDDRRRWYRYHHLFRDVLLAHLLNEHPDQVAGLHRRAGDEYARTGDVVPAVRHMLAAGEADRAAEIIERAVPELRRRRQEATLRRWIDDVPAAVVARRPVLAMGFVGALMASNEFGDAERRLQEVEHTLSGSDTAVADPAEFARLPAGLEMYRAALALVGGDLPGTLARARRGAELAGGDDVTRAPASALAGLAAWAMGDLAAAHDGYSAAAAGLLRVGYVSDVLGCSITLADLELTQGRLRRAERTFTDALHLGTSLRGAGLRGAADMHVGLSRIAYERDDLVAAAEHLRRSEALGEDAGLPQNPYRWRVAMALLREAEGDRGTAIGLLEEAERVYVGDFSPDVRPVAALRARMLAAHGDLAGALEWVRRRGVRTDDELSYLREYEHLVLARIRLAQHAVADAVTLLKRLLAAAEAGGRTGTVIEILVLLAAAGDDAASTRAHALAEPEGYVRVFAAELSGARPAPPHGDGLVEPLSDRELDVLRLLAGDLDGPSIARQLVVSLNTVRTHTKHIYTKLGVTNRRAAVRRAHQLNLLSRR